MQILEWILLIAHISGALLGAFGTTLSCMLFLYFLKDLKLTARDIKSMRKTYAVIWLGTLLFFMSSLGLVLLNYESFHPHNLVFALLISIIMINGLVFSLWVEPNLNKMAFNFQVLQGRRDKMHLWRRYTYASGFISLITWYTVLAIGFFDLNLMTPRNLLSCYMTLLVSAIFLSQVMEHVIFKIKPKRSPKISRR